MLMTDALHDADVQDEESHLSMHTVNDVPPVALNPWLRRTEWTLRFKGKNMKELIEQTLKPEDSDWCYVVWNGVKKMIEKSYEGVLDCHMRGWAMISFWLASAKKQESSNRPFKHYYVESTVARYIEFWQKYIVFCLRTMDDPEYGVEFTAEQKDILEHFRADVNLNELTDEDIVARLLNLSMALIKHCDYKRQRSSLIYFTGVLGYNVEGKHWRQAVDYTGILAGLQWCIRVISLEGILHTEDRDVLQDNEVDIMQRYNI